VKGAELTERRIFLCAQAQKQRDVLSYNARRLERPVRVLETSWRITRFLGSPILGALGVLWARRKRKRSKGTIGRLLVSSPGLARFESIRHLE